MLTSYNQVLKSGTSVIFQNVVWLKSTPEKLLRVHLESLIVRKMYATFFSVLQDGLITATLNLPLV